MSDKILTGAALAAAGVAAAGLMSARSAQAATPTTHVTFYFTTPPANTDANTVQIPNTSTKFTTASTDVQIVNFALAVETIEAERYRQTIARLTTGGTDMFGNPINGLGLSTSSLDVLLVTGFYATESQQRDILAQTLYGSTTANPFLNATNYLFDYGINNLDRTGAVMGIYTAETIGVSAYLGGSGLLAIQSPFLAPAASFLGVEARHAASLAYALNSLNGTTIQTAPLATDSNLLGVTGGDMPLTADQVLNQGGKVATGLLPATGGVTPAISGPAGFVYRPNAA
ncbi:MAG: ferritin-like domain-containing protein [Janthinobacterium lividum]